MEAEGVWVKVEGGLGGGREGRVEGGRTGREKTATKGELLDTILME